MSLIVARAVARAEEQALEAEEVSLEQRLEARLEGLDARVARTEDLLSAADRPR